MYVFIIPYCLALCGSRLCLFTTELHLVKKRLPPSKAMSKETVTEVPNVKKDDAGRQDPLTVGKSHKITGTMSPSQGMPQGQAFSTMIPPPRQPWWNTPMGRWRPFRRSGFAEWSMRSQGSIPSEWICRCGNDMLWCREEKPPIYETCRPCFDAMRAAGIDNEAWKARVRQEERDQLISEQAAAAETAKTGQS